MHRADRQVASFTDAWIETWTNQDGEFKRMSHLLQMRGLKRVILNHKGGKGLVASFTDAWIETDNAIKWSGVEGRIFYRCVD